MKKKHGVAVALIGNTGFIVLDVPINGLDPQGIVEKRELILKVNHKHDITVLIQIRTCETMIKLVRAVHIRVKRLFILSTNLTALSAIYEANRQLSRENKLPN